MKTAIIVGSGPNGLAAAIALAQRGLKVRIVEAEDTWGGGMRSAALTLPDFIHDICSAVHPLGVGSPFFQSLPLEQHGLKWIHPESPLAHPLENGRAVMLERSLDVTAQQLGEDARSYQRLMKPFVFRWSDFSRDALGPLHIPLFPLLIGRFGLKAIQPATRLAKSQFKTREAQALFAGLAAHSFLPLTQVSSAAIGLMLGVAGHAVGWPLPEGGSQKLADALVSYFKSLGGKIETGTRITSLSQVSRSDYILLDLTPRQVIKIAGDELPASYVRSLTKFRYGSGVFKLDWALSGPIPWNAAECARAATVHIGGTLEEITFAESAAPQGKTAERPFVLLTQPSLFDPSRAPPGKHTAWAYCHVPHGSAEDMTSRIEAQIERFAPGFSHKILARSKMFPRDLEAHNANLIGGDISGGVSDLGQLFFRPAPRAFPYSTPLKNLFICSSSTPPGGGVHGMCGFHAAQAVLKQMR